MFTDEVPDVIESFEIKEKKNSSNIVQLEMNEFNVYQDFAFQKKNNCE